MDGRGPKRRVIRQGGYQPTLIERHVDPSQSLIEQSSAGWSTAIYRVL